MGSLLDTAGRLPLVGCLLIRIHFFEGNFAVGAVADIKVG
jgi:hypothetical protein